MDSRWSDTEAQQYIARYVDAGENSDVALRVYTSRLLGGNPRLVLHGGGNTSVKTVQTDLLGDSVDVLCVKGSGWDLGDIEPAGLPAVRLAPLQRLEALNSLSDEDMVNVQRGNLLDSTAPNPSVETLLHAFLPHKFIDHTHSTAILSVSDQPDGEVICAEVFGDTMGSVPYIMPGFALAKSAAQIYRQSPDVDGLILHKHGVFTFGDSAQEAYERMIDAVTLAEQRLQAGRKSVFVSTALPQSVASVADVAPVLRGLAASDLGAGQWRRMVLDFRANSAILNYVNGEAVSRYSQIGVVTPDHNIRIKNMPVLLPAPEAGRLDAFCEAARAAFDAFQENYRAYFERHNPRQKMPKTMLDPMPRVALLPGLGLFGIGDSPKTAAIAADLAENNVETITDAEAIGTYECVSEGDLFDIEYWSLEQAKLGKGTEKPLARQVVAITGAGGAIGAATARAFANEGATVVALDVDRTAAQSAIAGIGGAAFACDVTDAACVEAAFAETCAWFGGVDIVVSNAGAAWSGRIGDVDDTILRQSFELNFFAHQTVAQAAVRIMQAQGTGGALLFNTSKQAVNPGPDFGPYGLPKAATLSLVRQYAIDHGAEGIRANAVNADRIRSGLLDDNMIAARAEARGVNEADYMAGNLLHREVRAKDVADAFVYLAKAERTTAAVITVDGGNIAAALR
ncbi:MAG: bifunctional aldolase/short-chain dehydrogenase [Alphaproteobacteria bacterium]|nr:bifunctional aldolase/short-chain dehydrogenase [Alphaproteobacteria bacterium]